MSSLSKQSDRDAESDRFTFHRRFNDVLLTGPADVSTKVGFSANFAQKQRFFAREQVGGASRLTWQQKTTTFAVFVRVRGGFVNDLRRPCAPILARLCRKRGRCCWEKFGPSSACPTQMSGHFYSLIPCLWTGSLASFFFLFFHGSHYWQPPVWRFPPIRAETTFSQAFKRFTGRSGWSKKKKERKSPQIKFAAILVSYYLFFESR